MSDNAQPTSRDMRANGTKAQTSASVTSHNGTSDQVDYENEIQSTVSPPDHRPDASGESEWPAPTPLDDGPTLRLDPDLLPGWLGEYARAVAAETETPIELAASMMLAVCSAAAARAGITTEVQPNYREPPNLWFIAALKSGSRKSAVHKAAIEPFVQWEKEISALNPADQLREEIDWEIKQTRIDLLKRWASATDDDEKQQRYKDEIVEIMDSIEKHSLCSKLWISDITPERLGTMLVETGGRIAFLSSEGGIFDQILGRYTKEANVDLFMKTYTGEPERVSRTGRKDVYVENPLLTIGVTPQPSVLTDAGSKRQLRDRGCLARFLYLLPPSNLGYRKLKFDSVPKNISDRYIHRIKTMLDWSRDEKVLRLSEAANSEWHSFWKEVEYKMRPGQPYERMSDWASKSQGNVIRLASVLHCIKHVLDSPSETPISGDTMSIAIQIMKVITDHSVHVLDCLIAGNSRKSDAAIVLSFLQKKQNAQTTIKDIAQSVKGRSFSAERVEKAINLLEKHGYVRVVASVMSGPGRPKSPAVILHPLFVNNR